MRVRLRSARGLLIPQILLLYSKTEELMGEAVARHLNCQYILPEFLDGFKVKFDPILESPLFQICFALTPSEATKNPDLFKTHWGVVLSFAREIKEAHDAQVVEAAGTGFEPANKKIRFSVAGKASVSTTVDSVIEAEQEVYFSALDEISRLREESLPVQGDLAIWHAIYLQMPIISQIARDHLPTQPTQTASERIFNRTKAFNVGRESTCPARVEKYCMSAMNMRTLMSAAWNIPEEEDDGVDIPVNSDDERDDAL